ncbi:MAG TPA: CHAD domain-containing protein [Patescibacteria group bacterium]|nr:CHAD domain-containing protein [Patescibacteria group bacterium]
MSDALGPALQSYADTQLLRAIDCLGWSGRRIHEGVHQARKSLRRVRACLALAGFERDKAGKALDRRIARACRSLSELRDAHARIETLDQLIAQPVDEDVRLILQRARRLLLESRRLTLAEVLREDPTLIEHREKLMRAHADLLELPWKEVNSACVDAAIAHSLKRCSNAQQRALAGHDPEDWHRWRRRRRRLMQQHAALGACGVDPPTSLDRQRKLADHLGASQDLSLLFGYFGHARRLPKADRDLVLELIDAARSMTRSRIERWLDQHADELGH